MSYFEDEYDRAAALKRRHLHAAVLCQFRIQFINAHIVADNASQALASSVTVKPSFNVEEEVDVIHNGWTSKEEGSLLYIYMYIVTVYIYIYITYLINMLTVL